LDSFLAEAEKMRNNNNNNNNNNDNNNNPNSNITPAQQALLTQFLQSFHQPNDVSE